MTTTSKFDSYKCVKDAYQRFSSVNENHPQHRTAQKTLFAAISLLFPDIGLPVVDQLHRDVFYVEAEKIRQGKSFQNSPGALNRLTPLAINYYLTFKDVLSSLKTPPKQAEELKKSFKNLGEAHLSFATAFVPEFKTAGRELSAVVCMEHPETLTLFLEAIFPHIPQLKPQIESSHEGLFTLIPTLAIEKLLSNRAPIPKFFEPISQELSKKRAVWSDLSSIEQDLLHRRLLGENVSLEPVSHELFKSIHSLASGLKRENANLLYRETLKELQKAVAMIERLPKKRVSNDHEAANALIQSCHLEDLPEALFDEKYRLPIQKGQRDIAYLIAREPKAAPWLKLAQYSCQSSHSVP